MKLHSVVLCATLVIPLFSVTTYATIGCEIPVEHSHLHTMGSAGLGAMLGVLFEKVYGEQTPTGSVAAHGKLVIGGLAALVLGALFVDQAYPQALSKSILPILMKRGDFVAFMLSGGASYILTNLHRLNTDIQLLSKHPDQHTSA